MESRSQRFTKPSGPRGLPILGSAPAVLRDPFPFWLDLNRSYGPVSLARLAWINLYVVNEPELVCELFLKKSENICKDMSVIPEATRFMGHGVSTVDGEAWRARRKLAAPLFQPKRIAGYVDTMVAHAERLSAACAPDETRDVHRDFMSLTLAITAKALLGYDIGPESRRIEDIMNLALGHITTRMFRLSQHLIPAWVPTSEQRRFHHALRELDGLIYAVLARCRTSPEADHLLARLSRAPDESGEALSDRALRDEIVGMLVAGYETTGLALTFSTYELARHPEAATKVCEELKRVAPGRRLCAEDLPQLVWTEAVVKEALRLYPPSYAISRKVEKTFELASYTIPQGSMVSVNSYAMHRNPRWFPDPDVFRPERWLGADKLPRGAYLPFGEGARLCIGNHFALAECKVVLATLLRDHGLSIEPGHALKLEAGVSLRPSGGMPIRVRRRDVHHAPMRGLEVEHNT
jgi:cytochrome P450